MALLDGNCMRESWMAYALSSKVGLMAFGDS